MIRLRQAIVVEGRYDKNALAQLVDAPIFVTDGFGIFRNPELLALLRTVAKRRGLIVLTDSDGAGLVIRSRLKSAIPPEHLLHAYIPDVFGKERRKAAPGREGKLGVEGMEPEVLIAALRNAGATVIEEEPSLDPAVGAHSVRHSPAAADNAVGALTERPRTSDACPCGKNDTSITKTDLYDLGLSGRPDSKEKRKALQKELGLPENLSSNALLTALNCITTREELYDRFGRQIACATS